jgi:hypothetical protein
MRRSVRTANEKMGDSIVLVFTENHEALLSEGMKRVSDSDFARQNSGIMSCLPMLVVNALPRSIRCSVLPSSMDSIQNYTSVRSWNELEGTAIRLL